MPRSGGSEARHNTAATARSQTAIPMCSIIVTGNVHGGLRGGFLAARHSTDARAPASLPAVCAMVLSGWRARVNASPHGPTFAEVIGIELREALAEKSGARGRCVVVQAGSPAVLSVLKRKRMCHLWPFHGSYLPPHQTMELPAELEVGQISAAERWSVW